MNLLVISNTFPNHEDTYVGSIFIKEQIKYLKNYFDNIYVISPAPYGIEYRRKTKHEYYEFDNVKVYFPKYFNFPPFYFWNRYFWIYFEMKTIKKLIAMEKMKFDLIHAHYTWPNGAVAIEMKKEFNVPVVITEHTSLTFRKVIEKKDPIYIKTWKACDAIIRVRKGDICNIIELGIAKEKIYYGPNGYGEGFLQFEEKSAIRKRLNLPVNKKIILNVGNLYSEVKGHKYLLEAMVEILKKRKDVFCIIVGEGKLRNNLENLILQLGLEKYVKLVGSKPYSEIPLWMNAADLFVLPSLSEGNPTVMFEALGSCLPFVGTRVGGVTEIITSSDYGLLCEPANPKDLAEKVLMALDKEWNRKKISKYANRFTWENIADKILNVYGNIYYDQSR